MPTAEAPFPNSQGSTLSAPIPLEPVSASVLRARETRRRDETRQAGSLRTACREVDEEVLLGGGFERGTVTGISAEEESSGQGIGIQLAFQTLATSLLAERDDGTMTRGMVVTTQPAGEILPELRRAMLNAVKEADIPPERVANTRKRCLERTSLSRVFDMEGLWEVLEELDTAVDEDGETEGASPVVLQPAQVGESSGEAKAAHGETPGNPLSPEPDEQSPPTPTPPQRQSLVLPELKPKRLEIADSEDEEEAISLAPSSSPLSSLPEVTPSPPAALEETTEPKSFSSPLKEATPPPMRRSPPSPRPPLPPPMAPAEPSKSASPSCKICPHPDIIIITHFSTLLTTLFTRKDRKAAHQYLQLLSSHMRYLTRNLPSSPLIMILNGTAPASASPHPNADQSGPPMPGGGPDTPPPNNRDVLSTRKQKPLDPTLRSIFNPPPSGSLGMTGYASRAADVGSRKNKPSFGMVFTQLLDVHLLCTRLPKEREDAERMFGGGGGGPGSSRAHIDQVWIVECLLDEVGVWEGGQEKEGKQRETLPRMQRAGWNMALRRSREQRWGAVSTRAGGGIVDAFEREEEKVYGEIRLAAGFGGPRV